MSPLHTYPTPVGLASLSNCFCHSAANVPDGRPTTCDCTVTDVLLSLLSSWLGPELSVIMANCDSLTCCPCSLMKSRLLTSLICCLLKASYLTLISYSYSPCLNLPSVFPLKAVCMVLPTVDKLRPSEAILSRSTWTLISGLPASTDN